MNLHGLNVIGPETVTGSSTFHGVNPATSQQLDPPFHEAGVAEVDRAMQLAESAFQEYRHLPAVRRAAFLNAIAGKIETDDALLQRANEETGLPIERLRGERGRTVGQLRLFAKLIDEGSWVGARIDQADPNRKPVPKPDLRRMLIPIGPVVVFAASNFPLAFSVAGGDTASALAAGCPVVVKAHPAHPGTSEWVGRLIQDAVRETGMPGGVFSLLHGRSHELGTALVKHPLTSAVGFTGSLRAGRALFDAAAARPVPIPVYAEMGSTNPVFLLPGALAERGKQIAEGLKQSVTLGVGQFCTNPGLVLAVNDENARQFAEQLAALMSDAAPGTMLYAGLRDSYSEGVKRFTAVSGVKIAGQSRTAVDSNKTQVAPTVFTTDAGTYLAQHRLRDELFGPATLLVTGSRGELMEVAAGLDGHLTATLHGTAKDLEDHRDLIAILERKVGRLIVNGFPTGVEVAPAMQHGGPYPATTDARTTSVGTAAIERFVRPICYQDFPAEALPVELRDGNPSKIWRLVDGEMTLAGCRRSTDTPGTESSGRAADDLPLISNQHREVVTEIGIQRGACFGECPIYSATFMGDGSVIYHGIKFVDHIGERHGHIPAYQFVNLAKFMLDSRYMSLQGHYTSEVTDAPTVTTTIVVDGKRKSVSDYADMGPSRLWAVEQLIDKLLQDTEWKKSQ